MISAKSFDANNRFSNNNRNANNFFLGNENQHNLIIEIEQTILCSVLIDESNIVRLIGNLSPNHFFSKIYKDIYMEMIKIYENKSSITMKTLENAMINNGCELFYIKQELSNIFARASNSYNFQPLVDILIDKSIRRDVGEAAHEIMLDIVNYKRTPIDLLLDAEIRLDRIKRTMKSENTEESTWSELSISTIKRIHENASIINSAQQSGVNDLMWDANIPEINYALGNLWAGDFIIIGGFSSIGKTILGSQLFHSIISGKNAPPTLFISGEMTNDQIMGRIISSQTGINSRYIIREPDKLTNTDIAKMYNFANTTVNYPGMIVTCNGTGIKAIKATIEESKNEAIKKNIQGFKDKFKVIIIDYLQLLAGSDDGGKYENRTLEIESLARWCKSYAGKEKVCVIALAQVNDEVLKRPAGNRIPQYDDIGWCRVAKNHADTVGMMWTDYYDSINMNQNGTGAPKLSPPDQEVLQIYWRKNRHAGFAGPTELKITRSLSKIESLSRSQSIP